MLTLALTLTTGERVRLEVEQAEFVRECPYCKIVHKEDAEFTTIDPDQIYCKRSHLVMYRRKVTS